MIPSVPSVSASNVPRPTLHSSLKLYDRPTTRSSVPGNTATHDPMRIQPVVRIVETHSPASPHGWTYGRRVSGCVYRSFSTAGKIHRYEISVVEIAMSSTTWNFALLPPLKAPTARNEKIVAAIPDMTLTRTGVPNV